MCRGNTLIGGLHLSLLMLKHIVSSLSSLFPSQVMNTTLQELISAFHIRLLQIARYTETLNEQKIVLC